MVYLHCAGYGPTQTHAEWRAMLASVNARLPADVGPLPDGGVDPEPGIGCDETRPRAAPRARTGHPRRAGVSRCSRGLGSD